MPEDTDAALEWVDYKASLCTGCGRPRSETFDPDGPEYVAEAWCCFACEERDQKAKAWREDEHADPAGIYFVVQERGEP